jgi:hypothetical protein
LNAPHSKCGIGASLSGVRIPPSPPRHIEIICFSNFLAPVPGLTNGGASPPWRWATEQKPRSETRDHEHSERDQQRCDDRHDAFGVEMNPPQSDLRSIAHDMALHLQKPRAAFQGMIHLPSDLPVRQPWQFKSLRGKFVRVRASFQFGSLRASSGFFWVSRRRQNFSLIHKHAKPFLWMIPDKQKAPAFAYRGLFCPKGFTD